jgi:hypothetical protein
VVLAYSLVTEKKIAIEFAQKEQRGSAYVAVVRDALLAIIEDRLASAASQAESRTVSSAASRDQAAAIEAARNGNTARHGYSLARRSPCDPYAREPVDAALGVFGARRRIRATVGSACTDLPAAWSRLLADLAAPRWKLTARGIHVELNEETKKRLGSLDPRWRGGDSAGDFGDEQNQVRCPDPQASRILQIAELRMTATAAPSHTLSRDQRYRLRKRESRLFVAVELHADLLDDMIDADLLKPFERNDRERAGQAVIEATQRLTHALLRRKYPGRYWRDASRVWVATVLIVISPLASLV